MTRRLIRCAALFFIMVPEVTNGSVAVDVRIEGIGNEQVDSVRASLSLVRQKDHPLLTEALLQRLHRLAPSEIGKALEPFGYYNAKVDSTLTKEGEGWRAMYRIDLGSPVRVTAVELEIRGIGATDQRLLEWKQQFPMKQGDVLHQGQYEEAKRALLNIARETGYFDGDFTKREIRINNNETTARISLQFETGPRFRLGEVRFKQNAFDESFLRRFVTFSINDPFDGKTLTVLQTSLIDSGYFQRVEVRPIDDAIVDTRVPIEVSLDPRKPKRYTFGAGFGTDTGPRGTVGFEHRHLNRRGHRLGATLALSAIKSEFGTRYRVPLLRPATDQLIYALSLVDEDSDSRRRQTSSIGVNFTHKIGRWQRTAGIDIERERFDLDQKQETTQLLIPKLSWQRANVDNPLNPRRGWRINTETRGAAESLLSDTSFLQLLFRGKSIYPLGSGRLLARGEIGATSVTDFSRLPPSLRMFTGGDNSVRGYKFDSLGPRNEEGQIVGGQNLFVASLEYEHPIRQNMALAAFIDVGDAFNSSSVKLNRGAGIGMRWALPFGALRIDLAAGLDRPGNPLRLHINLGPDL